VTLGCQPSFGRPRYCGDQSETVDVPCTKLAGEIDRAQQLAAVRIVDRCCGTDPTVQQLVEVLSREDLHRVVYDECCADRVRPDPTFATYRSRQKPRCDSRPKGAYRTIHEDVPGGVEFG